MGTDDLEVAVLADWLNNTDFGWLENVAYMGLSDGQVGRREADQMLRLYALYQSIRQEFPNIKPSKQMVDTFMHPDSDLYARFFCSPLSAACEMGRSGCYIGTSDVIAAAHLGGHGDLQAVLVACDLLCHGYDVFGGDGRPLIDEYRYFLPAVASYTSSAVSAPLASIEPGPGWWDADGRRNLPAKPNRLTRALNRTLDEHRRRALVGRDRVEQESPEFFAPVARVLGMDLTFLTPEELASAEDEIEIYVADLQMEDPPEYPEVTVEFVLEPMHLAYTIGKHLGHLLEVADGLLYSDADAAARMDGERTWLSDWSEESWRRADSWPEGLLREAIESSPWDQFIRY